MRMKKQLVELGMVADNKRSAGTDMPAIIIGLMKGVISAVQDPQLASSVSGIEDSTKTPQSSPAQEQNPSHDAPLPKSTPNPAEAHQVSRGEAPDPSTSPST